MINEQDTHELRDESKDRRNGLVLQSLVTLNSHQSVDGDGVVLDRRHTGHLNRGLDGAGEEKTAEAGLVGEELTERACGVLMLKGNGILDLRKFGAHPRIVDIAMRV